MALSGKEKLEVIVRDYKWTHNALPVIAFLCQQFALNHIDTADFVVQTAKPGTAGTKDLTVLQVALSSAPLVVAWAIIYVLIIRGVRGEVEGSIRTGGEMVWYPFLIFLAAAFIGNVLGFPHMDINQMVHGGPVHGGPVNSLIALLYGYSTTYGVAEFLSSIVVGIFGGRTFLRLFED
jgi:hypothetical protein